MNAIRKVLDRFLAGACVILFALLVIVVVWQVFTRQVLQSPSAWTDEVSRYIFVWVGLFATVLVFSERGHLAVDAIARIMPIGGRRVLGIIGQLAIIAFALVLLVYGGIRAAGSAWGQSLQSIPFTLGQMYIVLPITGVLIAFYALADMLLIAKGEILPFEDEVDPDAEKYLEDAPHLGESETGGATAAPASDQRENRN